MRSLKFSPHLVPLTESGEKTVTWRLFDDKFLETGDELSFVNKETGEEFGTAKITWVSLRTLGTLTDEDWAGHERFPTDEAMYEQYRKYYPGKDVGPNTEVKILTFEFTHKK